MEWTVDKVKMLKVDEIMDLFHTLSAPPFKELDGEYQATLLDQGLLRNGFSHLVTQVEFLGGRWLGKAFLPTCEDHGHGYNLFKKKERVIRKYRMKTGISASRFDGLDVFQLNYNDYKSLLGFSNMVDEVRKINTGFYLGIGTFGFTRKDRLIPLPFCLSGPVNPFVGSDREEEYWLQWLDRG